jgi:hypothetical protein
MNLKDNKKVLTYELIGIVFIIILGSVLHFTFEWSGTNPVVGAFSAVNESVWEHLKLAFWPTLLFALIELVPLRRVVNNFVLAKTASVYVMVTIIPAIFYSYTAFTGESLFAIDIASFVIAVIVGQLVSYKLLTYRKISSRLNWVALAFLVALAVAFVVFTFLPPQVTLFQDSVTGGYGIPK